MTPESEPVLVEIADRVGIATLNCPDRLNCISSALFAGLGKALDRFEHDGRVQVMLVRATGKHFCTGADLDEVTAARKSDEDLKAFINGGHEVLLRLERSRLAVVVALHGLALAGGLELMMSTDVVIAARSARVGDQHAQFGLVPGWGGTQRLARLVGLRRALYLMFTAKWLSAAEALEWGLVSELVDDEDLADRSLAFCRQLAARNPEGVAAMKSLARRGLDLPLPEALRLEAEEVCVALQSENASEGLRAFKDRRDPVFD